ncbi:MAG: TIGR00341 family protein [Schleiferiaceae bacterium]|nr:TIGR00341 family protein [Schleiferiaceae bacterium]
MAEKDDHQGALNEQEENHEQVEFHAKGLYASLKQFLHDRLSIKDLEDSEKTIDGILKDVEFSGFNVWILIFSILICSIGLNANSIAVVIGAMLISPLMGPIMGMGLSIGINDLTTLKKSLRSLGFAVLIAVFTSFVFFLFVPLGSEYSELLARTRPDVRDVFIAIFGGLTGILAGSRKEKTNVIPGVAIATALMPPLCTAGYGLASGHMEYFIGAFYLFIINTFFIALATLVVVRYLRFPVVTFVSKERESNARRVIIFFTILIIVPSVFVFYQVVKETYFYRSANEFVTENIYYEGCEIIKHEVVYDPDGVSSINLAIIGDKIPQKTIDHWQDLLNKSMKDVELNIFQGNSKELAQQAEFKELIDVFGQTQSSSLHKDERIKELENEIANLKKDQFPSSISEELKIQFPGLAEIDIGMMVNHDFENKLDTIPTVFLEWHGEIDNDLKVENAQKISSLLRVRLSRDSVYVRSIN